MSREDELGERALKLLAEERMVAVLEGLAGGALRPTELERRLPDGRHSLVMRRLHRLLERELVTYEHRPGRPPHPRRAPVPHEAHYELTGAGRALLEVTAGAVRWEEGWRPRAERRGPPGALAIRLTADEHMREIALLLADRPLSTSDLDERMPGLGRSALRRRLRELVLAGLLERSDGGRIPRRYELTDRARHLALVAMLAGRWEWRWSRPARPAPGRDLGELLRMLAPVARTPERIAGACRLRFDTVGAGDHDIYLAARAGHLIALSGPPVAPPDAAGRATPAVWCDTLLGREGPIAMSGDEELLMAVIAASSAALLA